VEGKHTRKELVHLLANFKENMEGRGVMVFPLIFHDLILELPVIILPA
jgi:hypothetical protein